LIKIVQAYYLFFWPGQFNNTITVNILYYHLSKVNFLTVLDDYGIGWAGTKTMLALENGRQLELNVQLFAEMRSPILPVMRGSRVEREPRDIE